MDDRQGWFADVDPEEAPRRGYEYQPCLQLEGGICLSFDVWFKTEDECVDYIRTNIIGKQLLSTSLT